MKKLIKVIGILAVVLIVLVGGLLVAAKILITPERVRQVVIPLAEEHLKRPVSIGDIDVRLFSGIVISDFTVGGRDDADDFVAAESMVLRYQFLPLLRLSVVVDEVRLNLPDIRIERYEDGEFNFSDLLPEEKPGDDAQASAESPEDAPEDEAGGPPIDVLVNEITIADGQLVFIDHMIGARNELTDFSVSIDRFSMDRDFPVDLSAKINNAPFHVDGTINPMTQAVTADVRIQDLDVAAFMAYAPDDFPGQLSGMTVGVDIRAEATEQAVDSDGRITVSDINFLPDDMPDAHIENGRISLDYDVGLDLASETITITKADADINGIALAASGRVLSYGSEPTLDITANLPMISFSDIIAAVPPKIIEPVLEKMRPVGSMGAQVHLEGKTDQPETLLENGEITLEKAGIPVEGKSTPEFSGGIIVAKADEASDNPVKYLFDVSAEINRAPIHLEGTITPETMHVDALASIEDLDAAAFMAYAPDDFPGQLSGMTVNVDIRAEATEQTVDSDGHITVSDINFLPDDMPDAHIENGRVSLDYDVGLDLDSERIAISKANADINGIAMAASGHVLSYGSAPELDITANLPMIALSDIIAAVPPKIVEPVVEMKPAGRIGARVHLKGAPDKPETLVEQGKITLERVGATVNSLTPKVTGDIRLENDSAASDNMEIRLTDDLVRLDFSADNLMGTVKTVRHTLTADELDIDALLAAVGAEEADSATEQSNEDTGTSEGSQELGPLDLPLDVEGDVRVGSAVFHDLEIDSLDLRYRLKDNVFTMDHIRGNLADGSISGKARAELNRKPITYTADISVDGSRAEVILNALFPKAANTVFGTFFLETDIKGEGTSWDTISQALTARGDVNVADGKLTGTGIAGGFADFLGSGKLDVIAFDSLKGGVALEDGKFNVDTEVDGQDVRMSPVGTIGLDSSLDLSLDLRLAPQVISDIGGRSFASTYAQTDEGWTMVPVKVGGTLRSPKFRVDAAAVTRQLKERGKDELRKQLEERLFPKDDGGQEGEETDKQEKRSIEKDVEDAVRDLFN